MCVQFMKIKSRNEYAPKFAFVPCGKCEECRQSANNQWFFRLRSELDWCRKNDWKVGFFTLTYSEDKIPRLPEEFVKRVDLIAEKGLPYCFSRYDVRTFIDNIRKRLHETYGIKGIKYMICAEYGSDPKRTQRSHYHGLIAFPSYYEDIDKMTGEVTRVQFNPRDLFQLIHSQWSPHGFVFPRDFLGGIDSHGYRHKPFLLETDVANAARYAAKYTCKDIGYFDHLAAYGVDFKDRHLKPYKPFHIQSRSIGLGFLANKSTDELLKLLRNGVDFVGDKYRRSIPLYIRNKILYTPSYSYTPVKNGDWFYDFVEDKWHYRKGQGTYRRLVGKEATQFFKDNLTQIFNQKKEYYSELFREMQTLDFWTSRGLEARNLAVQRCLSATATPEQLAEGFLAYYGLPAHKCFAVPPEQMYITRFMRQFRWTDQANYDNPPLVSDSYYRFINRSLGYFVGCLENAQRFDVERRRKAKRVSDFYKHAV